MRCFKCREYDHFTKDCPNSETERESEQIQQMYYLEKKSVLKVLATDTYDDLIGTNSDNTIDHLNL